MGIRYRSSSPAVATPDAVSLNFFSNAFRHQVGHSLSYIPLKLRSHSKCPTLEIRLVNGSKRWRSILLYRCEASPDSRPQTISAYLLPTFTSHIRLYRTFPSGGSHPESACCVTRSLLLYFANTAWLPACLTARSHCRSPCLVASAGGDYNKPRQCDERPLGTAN